MSFYTGSVNYYWCLDVNKAQYIQFKNKTGFFWSQLCTVRLPWTGDKVG